jgi:hypothetical protein
VAAEKFETSFTMKKGFAATWFDLAHDPDKKVDLSCKGAQNGPFWVKLADDPGPQGNSWFASPAQKMELLENTPTRVRVRLSGWHMRNGYVEVEKHAMKYLPFELTYTVYPTGAVYVDYILESEKPLKLHHFVAIIRSTGAWSPQSKSATKGEVHPASELGNDVKPGSKGPASWVLQWSNGTTYFADMLMVFHKGKFGGTYWNEGYPESDYRTGLDLLGMFPEKTLPAGKTHIPFLFRIADDMNGAEAAAAYANDYRTPDALAVTKGAVDKGDPGDFDADGFNESEGCYVLKAQEGSQFTLHGKAVPRMSPVFKVKGWTKAAVSVKLGDAPLRPDEDFNASVTDGVLVLQLFAPVKDDVRITLE